jgi:hypothetical protein
MIPYRSGTALGTMATATATDYVAKALFTAQTILSSVGSGAPAAMTVAEQRIVGRTTGGNIAALTPAQVIAMLVADGSWPSTGRVVQVKNYATGAAASGTTAIPNDDTIPQNTEGDEYLSVSITPTSAANYLLIFVNIFFSNGVFRFCSMALFQDTTANALAASGMHIDTDGYMGNMSLIHYMQAGTSNPTTLKVRAGNNGAGTFRLNSTIAGRTFGGVASSSITVVEIAA